MDPARPSTMEASPYSAILDAIEQQPLLDRAGGPITRALDALFENPAGQRAKDLLHGRWLGHALHPVLTDLPIGFWTSSLLLDLLGARASAGVLQLAGSASALAAAATGAADWTATDGRERRLGLAHGLLNTGGLVLQVASFGRRLTGRQRSAVRLSMAGYALTAAAAWIGGELVYGRGLMVNHDAWTAGPAKWTPVLEESELPDGRPVKVEVEGRAVLLYREGRRVSAMENACTHAGGPLDEGEVTSGGPEGATVTCPWHGSRFRLRDGSVCHGPATYPQLRLEARVSRGSVEIRGRQG